MKVFNTTAVCIPEKHYMVDLSDRVAEIRKMVDAGKYFTINRARQYGKTTTISALRKALVNSYNVASVSFEKISKAGFENEQAFVKAFCRLIKRESKSGLDIDDETLKQMEEYQNKDVIEAKLDELFDTLAGWCERSNKPIVLIIDEVDSATNNQVFLDFLGQLRSYYLDREEKETVTFQSVILAGMTDVKHLKSKIRPEEEAKENSPWNIAADFTVDMSLPEDGIHAMLDEYESDHHTGMDTAALAERIRDYTNGYPFLVSRICQLIDERMVPDDYKSLSEAWTFDGVETAVKRIITEENTLFESVMGKLRTMPKLKGALKRILMEGETIATLPDNDEQKQLRMYGFIVNDHNAVAIANRIFEMRLYNYYIGEGRFADELRGSALDNKPEFIKGGELNVPLIMQRFIETQKYIRDLHDEEAERKFLEEDGREKFLTYLSPIINGVGTFSVEEQTRNRRRMDVVIHYRGKRYVIEMKIWHGDRYNKKGEEQISEYLDYFGLTTGYMLSFNFNKNKETGVRRVEIGDKVLFEGMV